MARDMRWNISLADLAMLVLGFALTTATLRFVLADELKWGLAYSPLRFSVEFLSYSTTILGPLSWTLAVMAMLRTRRPRWASHPAILVGLASFLFTSLELGPAFRLHTHHYLRNAYAPFEHGVIRIQYTPSYVSKIFDRELSRDVSTFLAALFLVGFAAGRLRRPDDWLQVAGWLLGLGWVGGLVARYVARYF